MDEIKFIQDLAIIMTIAGLVTVIFHRLKQPIVLGYIIAGVIIGPHTPPFSFITDEHTINIFSEIGVIFLMFSLGLEFSLRKLAKVGISALVSALLEILAMIWIGYQIGHFFHWGNIDSLFLGAMLAISSTTIIIKTLRDLDLSKQHFAQLIFGILVIEDILAIAILALLSSIGTSELITTADVALTLGKLLLFLTVSLFVGILIVPRLLSYVAKFKNQEIFLITILGLCFGFCLLVLKLHYSIVLGAFTIGAIIGEARQVKSIEHLIEPLRDMFSAIFFVAIGLMLDPRVLITYTLPIIVITIAVILGKVFTCSLGTFVTGHGARRGFRVGMGLAQIGEFSFIIAALGLSLKVTSNFLYPIVVTVSAITTLFTPYLIKFSNPIAASLKKIMPNQIVEACNFYTEWLEGKRLNKQKSEMGKVLQRGLFVVGLNLLVVMVIFLGIPYVKEMLSAFLFGAMNHALLKVVFWAMAFIVSLPFLMAVYHKLQIISMILVKFNEEKNISKPFPKKMRKIALKLITICPILIPFVFIMLLSAILLLLLGNSL